MSWSSASAAVERLRAAAQELAACDLAALTAPELLEVLDGIETVTCQLPSPQARALARLQQEARPPELGAKSFHEVLRVRWRLSTQEAGRRLGDAADLAPGTTIVGQPHPPKLPATAAAQRHGLITAEHLTELRTAMRMLPGFLDAGTRAQIEVDLVRKAILIGPEELREAAKKMVFLLDQDGPVPNDRQRQRQRGVHVSPQGRDGMIDLKARLTPEAWALYEPILAKLAAPGMCNPADAEPCVSGTPSQTQIDADERTLAQRRHDALIAVGRNLLESGDLGQHNGLPTTVIIRTTVQDLISQAGVGVTGGGTVLSHAELITMASHANHYLAIFDRSTGAALNLFRSKRVATPAQRIMLIARDGGCTKPCCTVGAYGTQVHHATKDWAAGGNTNVDDMTLACGGDNRSVGPDGWTTRINAHGQCEWIPPEHLDTGQARINYVHTPERLLRPGELSPEPPESNWYSDILDTERRQAEHGGPEPPDDQAA